MASLPVVLLTGGESRRLGRDKATLILDGQPLWQRQLNLLRALSPETIFVSARERPSWCPPDVVVVLDEPPSNGPLSGLVAALKHLRTTHLFVLAVDLPDMTVDHLRSLWSSVQPGRGIIPQQRDYYEPLCAIYPLESRDPAAQLLVAGQFSLQLLARTLVSQGLMEPHPLKADELPFYHNANFPADLDRLD